MSHVDGDRSIGGEPWSEESVVARRIGRDEIIPKLRSVHSLDFRETFLHGLPYMWADKKYYNVEPNMLPFDFIQPFVDEYNKLRCEVSFLLLFSSVA